MRPRALSPLLTLTLLGAALAIFFAPRPAAAQSLEDLELKKAGKKTQVKKKLTLKSQFSFGFLGIVETQTGINRERPDVSTLIWAAPQLKFRQLYRLQLNMGFSGYYLSRSPNPWDLTDWSLQLSALQLWKEKHSGIRLSGNLRYYLPTSVASRNADSRGALRGLVKLTRSVWKLYFGFELMAYYHFARYATWDPDKWWDEDRMLSNTQATLGERLIVSYSPIKKLTFSFLWTFYQLQEHPGGPAPADVGSSLVTEGRQNREWEHAWSCIFDVTWNAWKWFYVAGGYSATAPVLQADRRGTHWNPFNARNGKVYLDLMFIY